MSEANERLRNACKGKKINAPEVGAAQLFWSRGVVSLKTLLQNISEQITTSKKKANYASQ